MTKKNLTLDQVAADIQKDLARLQRGLDDVRKDMVTKLELHDTESRVRDEIRDFRKSVEASSGDWIDLEAKWEGRFHSLEQRVGRLEKKR